MSQTLALYIDLENLTRQVDLDRLLKHLDEGKEHTYAVKSAYGCLQQIPNKVREQLRDHNFRIVDTPHVAGKKNRADLIISVDAFERIHVDVPRVDRFIFVTSDADFSVIMDRLRTYGKEVWLVCRKADQSKKVFSQSCDRMLAVEDFLPSVAAVPAVSPRGLLAERLLKEVLRDVGPHGLPLTLGALGEKMQRRNKNFSYRGTGFRNLTALVRHLEKQGFLKTGTMRKCGLCVEDFDDSQVQSEEEIIATTAEPSLLVGVGDYPVDRISLAVPSMTRSPTPSDALTMAAPHHSSRQTFLFDTEGPAD